MPGSRRLSFVTPDHAFQGHFSNNVRMDQDAFPAPWLGQAVPATVIDPNVPVKLGS